MVGTGYGWLQEFAINAGARDIAAGNIGFLGIGRVALAYPDFAKDALLHGDLDVRRVCKALTHRTFLMRQKNHPLGQLPTGCHRPSIRKAMGRLSSRRGRRSSYSQA